MRMANTIAIQEQPKPYVSNPEFMQNMVNNIFYKGVIGGVIMFLRHFWPLALLVIVIYIYKIFFATKIKGKSGERRTKKLINRLTKTKKSILQEETITMNNIMIPDSEGGSTQIDHIILTVHGIFIIETKNLSGWIFGKTSDEFWTIKHYHTSSKMQNPFRQNYKHVMCLAELLQLDPKFFINVVVLRGDCEVKTMEQMPFELATTESELEEIINSHEKFLFSQEDLSKFHDEIMKHTIPDTAENRKKHIEHLEYIHK